MKTKAGVALVAGALSIAAVALYGADASPIAGKWATDAVANVEMPEKTSIFKTMVAGAVNGGNTSSSIGNANGSPTISVPTVGNNGRGGGGRGMPGGPGMPGAAGPGGPATPRESVFGARDGRITAKDVVEAEPAISMELKVDAKGNLTGTVTVITVVPVHSLKEHKVEEGKVTDKKFEFKTNEKSEKVSNTTRWAGELTDETTITVQRLTKGGQPMDSFSILFHRAK